MPVSELLNRQDVPAADTWDLTPIFPDDASWEAEFNALGKRYDGISAFRGTLSHSAQDLAAVLEFEKSLDQSTERLGQYASLRVTEDSSASAALDREGRFSSLCARISEACSWVAPEIQSIPDDDFESFLTSPALSDWRISLRKLRRLKPHVLGGDGERLLSLAMPPLAGHSETFSQLTNVDMIFGKVTDERGLEIELTQSSFSSLLQRPDRGVRKAA